MRAEEGCLAPSTHGSSIPSNSDQAKKKKKRIILQGTPGRQPVAASGPAPLPGCEEVSPCSRRQGQSTCLVSGAPGTAQRLWDQAAFQPRSAPSTGVCLLCSGACCSQGAPHTLSVKFSISAFGQVMKLFIK